jgi:hypothetical protein
MVLFLILAVDSLTSVLGKTTLTGRAIAHHMDSFVNECITGNYDHVGDALSMVTLIQCIL